MLVVTGLSSLLALHLLAIHLSPASDAARSNTRVEPTAEDSLAAFWVFGSLAALGRSSTYTLDGMSCVFDLL
jgi:hypothetical protein